MPIIDLGNGLKVNANGPAFPGNTTPIGWLTRDAACQALWYFYNIARERKAIVGNSIDDQIILEGQDWLHTYYRQQMTTVCKIYGVTPEEMYKFWPAVRLEIARLKWPEPPAEIMNLNERNVQ